MMRNLHGAFGFAIAASLLCALCIVPCVRALADGGETNWELQPYRLRVYLAVSRDAALTPQFQQDLLRDIEERCDLTVGAAWDVSFSLAPAGLANAVRRGIDALQPGQLPDEALAFDSLRGEEAFHKVLILWADYGAQGYEFTAREYDVTTRIFQYGVTRTAGQRETAAQVAFAALAEAVSPLGLIEKAEAKTAVLRIRGGLLAAHDERLTQITPGSVFLPVIRVRLPDGSAKDVRPLDWTWLQAENAEGPTVACKVYSGLRSPLSARRRGRTQQLAIRVRPPQRSTKLRLVSSLQDDAPLQGYDVYAYSPASPATTLLGQTDAQGSLTVHPNDDPLRILLVRSGGAFVARLPIVPGVKPEAIANVFNDQQRLAVEGYLFGLQEDVIETVVQREVLIARIRARLKAGEKEGAARQLEQLRNLPNREKFLTEIAEFEKRVFTNDPRMKGRIDKLFADTRALVDKYLNASIVAQVTAEVMAGTSSTGNASNNP